MKKKWNVLPKINASASKKLNAYPTLIQQLLYNRGIATEKQAEVFLNPENQEFYDFSKMHDSKKAAKSIIKAIAAKKKIFIHGDYDVDGICATSILWDFLHNELGADVLPYIPSRFDEGYGMTDESLSAIKKQGGEFVITVDCGIKDDELVTKWRKKGLAFVVTDHHELKKEGKDGENGVDGDVNLPTEAQAIVHPAYPEHEYPQRDICGATVAWKLVEALVAAEKKDADISQYLDLVALATVCDVMPLVDENRLIVKKGIDTLRGTKRPGLRRLMYDSGIEPEGVEAYHLGFVIGPRLNAAGRLDHALEAVRLLCTKSLENAREISEKLQNLNRERQEIQQQIYDRALSQIQEVGLERKLYFAWGDDWEEGVIGIVAGKISETYHRPVLIATRKGDVYTGSARSTSKFSIIDAITAQSELLQRYGGHPQAAGFTVGAEMIENFRDNLLEIADRELSDDDTVAEIDVDGEIALNDISWEMYDLLKKFEPFGYKNSRPKFLMKDVTLTDVSFVGKDKTHLRISLRNPETGKFISGIGFGLAEKWNELDTDGAVDLLFTIEENEWNGNVNLQLNLKDIRGSIRN